MRGERPSGSLRASDERAAAEEHLLILARKALLRNTRIFKQAKTLTAAGYSVTVVGIRPKGAAAREEREGYVLLRLQLNPLNVALPRWLRHVRRRVELAFLGVPRRYHRRAAQLRRRRRRLIQTLRRRRRLLAHGLGRRRRLLRLRLRRLSVPGKRLLRPAWARMRPYLRALLHVGGEEGSATGEVTPARWVTLAGTPLVVVARLARATATTCRRLGRAGRYQANRLRERGSIHAPLRWFTRALARGLKSATEAGIRLLNGVLRTFAFPLRSLSYYRLTYRTVTRDLPRPAIIHANDLDTLLIAVVLSKRFRVPLIYDAQEFYTGLHTLPGWYKRFLSVQERLLIRHADGVTVVNDAIADVMARKYGVRVSSVVLNCPPYEERPSPATRGTVRAAARVPDEEVVLLYSGGLTKNRGIENTILALRYLPGASLVVLGEGALKEALEELAGANGLRGRVLFKDFIPHRDVPRFISSADVGIIPYENVGINHYLCSPSKLFHYIMAELPIACSDFPFLRQVVVTNELGKVFDPSDPESIADAVRGLVSVPGTLAACRARLNLVKRRYCWEEEARKMMAVYRSVAPAARPGTGSESLLRAAGLADR